ncbi:GNAT family N-acetyltransferase [Luteimonas aquatica]|uniref:GNAT family N-acetyltransferase n=1 Tax=Luteimonas aquatica TaxID=450364 RepID=UPI001F59A22B|nr:GNAT family N-acetyltransferase [Luteimonas aquatica]
MAVARIRPGRAEEAQALIAIERRAVRLLRGHEAHALFAALTTAPETHARAAAQGRSWVAEADARAVGYALYELPDGPEAAAHLLQMDVDPAYGRRGIGRALLERACQAAAAQGAREIVLTTLADVPWNAPFYAGAGFVTVPEQAYTPQLRAILARERAAGFPMHLRVAMRRALRED